MGTIDQKIPASHYSQLIDPYAENSLKIELNHRLSRTKTAERYYVKVLQVNNIPSNGQLLLSLNQSKETSPLDYNNFWIIKGYLTRIKPPLNPGGFNYKSYLSSLKIYHQFNANREEIIKAEANVFSIQKYQAFLVHKLRSSGLNSETIAILETILLGERNALDRSIKDEFSKAGVIHLFAISGLHIGLLMLFFRQLFQPLRFFPHGKLWQSIGVLFCLWAYAFLVGGSASVIRAVSLFSAYQIGQNSGRKLPTAYLVLLSMGVLLFVKPNFIVQLGFQMSYLAVFGILFLAPLFHINFKLRPIAWFWQLTTVSIAAQIAVAPLSIYHFDQFPGLFLLSNWVILPFMGLFLYGSIILLLWLMFTALPPWFVWLEDNCVALMVKFVKWIAGHENFILKELYFDSSSLVIFYFILGTLVLYLKSQKPYWIVGSYAGLLSLYFTLNYSHPKQLWITHQYKKSVVVGQENQTLAFYTSDSLTNQMKLVQDFKRLFPYQKTKILPLKNVYRVNGISLLPIDGPWVHQLEVLPSGFWLLQNNAKINLMRLLERTLPKKVIIDGSNSPYYINQWSKTLKQAQIPFHITGEKGALSLNLENVE